MSSRGRTLIQPFREIRQAPERQDEEIDLEQQFLLIRARSGLIPPEELRPVLPIRRREYGGKERSHSLLILRSTLDAVGDVRGSPNSSQQFMRGA